MEKIPCLYLFIYKIFRIKSNGKIFVSHATIREVLRRRLHKIPRVLHYEVLKEMEGYKLIKRIGNTKNLKYELLSKNKDKLLNRFNLPI